jgi:cell division protein FtsL
VGRVAVILLVLVMLCAMGVITSQHRARKYFNDLEVGQAAAKKLDEEFGQLQIEQSTWATHKRSRPWPRRSSGCACRMRRERSWSRCPRRPPKAEAPR